MAATVWVALLLVFSLHTTPAQGYRIRKDRSHTLSSTGGLIHQVGQRRLLQGDNPCGQFADSDPYDGTRNGQTANWHTPCYAGDGTLFCCPAGSTECSCPPNPPPDGSNLYCYNYILSNDLNSNTNQPCPAFLPGKDPSASSAKPASVTAPTPTPSAASGDPLASSSPPVVQAAAATNSGPDLVQSNAGTTSGGSGEFSFPQGTGATMPLQPDGTCGFDPAGQAYNLCRNSLQQAWCCMSGFVCPTADPTVASSPDFANLAFICIPLGSTIGFGQYY